VLDRQQRRRDERLQQRAGDRATASSVKVTL
jgi:hypothetical protein